MPVVSTDIVVVEGGTELRNREADLTVEALKKHEASIAANQTDKQLNIAFDKDFIDFVLIVVSQDMTLETNSGSTPGNTFALKKDRPFYWRRDCGIANPFSVDVTALFITNTTAGTFKIWVGEDVTP